MKNIDKCLIGKYKMSSFNPESGILPARRLPNFFTQSIIYYEVSICQGIGATSNPNRLR